jgi:hypothetical protein
MLSPLRPLDRARLLVLVRVRLFGYMLQHGHETVKTLTHLGVLPLECMTLTFRLYKTLTPLCWENTMVCLVLTTL